MARGVTCRECGCLNFSSEHEVCDKCRSQTLTFRPTARRLTASTSNAMRSEDSDGRAHSNGKKRRIENASKKTQEDTEMREREKTKKQPDVIDLISDEEEEEEEGIVVAQQVARQSLSTTRREEEEEEKNEANNEPRALFQSRVFSSVAFAASDFPSMEEATQMRKKAASQRLPHSQPTSRKAAIAAGGRGQDKPAAGVPRAAEKTVDPRPAEPRPPPAIVEDDKEKTAVTVTPHTEKKEKAEGEKVAAPAATPSTAAAASPFTAGAAAKVEGKLLKQPEEKVKEEDPLVHSRVLDAIEFKASDFATVFEGLAVARRSHPPASSSVTSTYVGPAAIAPTVPTGPKANEVPGPARAATVASTTTPAPSSTTTKTTSEAKATGTPAESAARKVPTTTAPAPAPAQSSATPPSTTTLQSVWKAPATSAQPVSAKATLTPATATPSTKATPTLIRPSSAPGSSGKLVVSQTTLSKSSPAPVPPKSASTTPVSMAMKSTSTTIPGTKPAAATAAVAAVSAAAGGSAATKASSTLATNSNQTQANGSVNVLLPKKKHPEGIKRADKGKRHTKPSPIDVNTSAEADGVEFVKVNAAPLGVLPVEVPVLGYCSPEFLAFMRECGDEDGDEDDDPEEVSRSQLKLLDVVDLTNLSDSEDSEAESPLPTPRDGTPLKSLPANGQAAAAVGNQSTATANASGTGTWYVPTLESERKRTQPEKVMCELCEEKGLPYRLIRCPTCTKYYHKKCAKENGDENVCWNCDLGSLIDDSELDEEHAKHNSEYLAYLKAIRRSSSSPEDGEDDQEEEDDENEDQEGEEGGGEDDVEMKSPAEGGEGSNPFSEGGTKHGGRWKEFVGDATGDIDASYLEVTNRIAEELRDEEKRRVYSRGFVSREEFEAQMTEVEEYYISEEARLQQLEREKALEAKKAADARKAAEQASNGGQLADSSASENNAASVPASIVQDGANAGGAVNNAVAQPSTTTPVAPLPSAVNAPTTTTTAPVAVPIATHSTAPHLVTPTTARTAVPAPALVPVPTPAFAAAFWAAFATPPSKP
ncbi:hypothetical protein PHYPSEUDO_006656 [Phytophthora pseudosyringae]|uniref:Uncharacterized protein n=1 Tax=Phytophthora pseudosyringae TaxID=221518 RepID=A0A8T1WET2_9STRA|nr:hypothetical protein PHYPSEUDO_006656 [Phytophthora pseudosyringae]